MVDDMRVWVSPPREKVQRSKKEHGAPWGISVLQWQVKENPLEGKAKGKEWTERQKGSRKSKEGKNSKR